MKTFVSPKMEIIRLENADIITTSQDTEGKEYWEDLNGEGGNGQ